MSAGTQDSFQVSPQQEEAWEAQPDGPAARTQAVLAIDGEVDRSAIQDALRLAVRRHESLRTTFVRQPGLTLPLQVVNERLTGTFTFSTTESQLCSELAKSCISWVALGSDTSTLVSVPPFFIREPTPP